MQNFPLFSAPQGQVQTDGAGEVAGSGFAVSEDLGKSFSKRSVVKPSGAMPMVTVISWFVLSCSRVRVSVWFSQTILLTLYLMFPSGSFSSSGFVGCTSNGSSVGVKETAPLE